MIDWFFRLFNRKIVYVCDWGTYDTRYDSLDFQMGRPIHPDMKNAPPWAKMRIVPRDA